MECSYAARTCELVSTYSVGQPYDARAMVAAYRLEDELTHTVCNEALRIASERTRTVDERARAAVLLRHVLSDAGFDKALERRVADLCVASLREPAVATPLIDALLCGDAATDTRKRIAWRLVERASADGAGAALVHTVCLLATPPWIALLDDPSVRRASEESVALGDPERAAYMLGVWCNRRHEARAWVREVLATSPQIVACKSADYTLLILAPSVEGVRAWAERGLRGERASFHAWAELGGDGDELERVLSAAMALERDADTRAQIGRWLRDVRGLAPYG